MSACISSSWNRYIACHCASSCQQWLQLNTYMFVSGTQEPRNIGLYHQTHLRNRYIALTVVQQEPRTCRDVSSGSYSGTDISLAYRASSCQQWLQLTYIYVPCLGTTRATHMSACIIRLIFRNRYIARLPCFVLSAMAATDIHICSGLYVHKSRAHVGLYRQAHLPGPIYRLLTVLRLVNSGCN
ncbi:hypothetical protein J6590_018409 [Homalodisca vitripennis]|nr:hypothetical protein J6590_018409 [Homalodisca vitripennis]